MVRRPCAAALFALALAGLFWSPAFFDLDATGYGDWQMIWHNWEAGRVAIERHGEWPLWDPFHCGGVPIFGNPESQHFSPLFPLALVLGTTLALKLFLVLHAAAGFFGAFVFARAELGRSPLASWLAAVGWAGSGWFAWQGSGGHATFLPLFFTPLVLLSFRRGTTDRRYAALLGGLMALTVAEGGTYPFPYFVLLLALDAAVVLASDRVRRRGVLRALALGAVVCGLLGAIRFLPIADTLAATPRTVESTDSVTLAEMLSMLVDRRHDYRWGHEFVWAEYGSFMGWGCLGLAAIGLVGGLLRRGARGATLALALGAAVFGLFVMGSASELHPWPLVRHLPIYDSLRVPSRFAVFLTFYLAMLAGTGVDALRPALARLFARGRARARAPTLVAGILFVGVTADLLEASFPVIDRFDWAPLLTIDPVPEHFLIRPADYIREYASYPQRGVGTRYCYIGAMEWPISPALWEGPVPQARVLGGGRVLSWRRTTSAFFADVSLDAPGRLFVNQNHFAGWESSLGTVGAERGLLTVELPAGRHEVALRYRPRTLWPGLGLSLAGVVVTASLARKRR